METHLNSVNWELMLRNALVSLNSESGMDSESIIHVIVIKIKQIIFENILRPNLIKCLR